ncbi:hypothetical protein MLD38_029213 [Melastoma candidum]|uniref:Uncharacterized protein n=1 Tax=Melastoma candidum TaxID=119954 RepID=A0ACB9N580_9MYRT|nr:hypothetical protein MLD38_029213 [Melastoma candidum]
MQFDYDHLEPRIILHAARLDAILEAYARYDPEIDYCQVLQRRKLITQRHNCINEILRECNDMAGQLHVWKLLDDARDLVLPTRQD